MNIQSFEKGIHHSFVFLAFFTLVSTGTLGVGELSSVKLKWDFGRDGNTEGWTIPEHLNGRIQGDALWISITTPNMHWLQPMKNGRPWEFYTIDSPKGLGIPANKATKVKLRLLNLSPETDGYVQWVTTDALDTEPENVDLFKIPTDRKWKYFSIKPYYNQWQEVTCHIDSKWKGTIDQIHIGLGLLTHKGDIWIDWIAITDDPPRPPLYRPDLNSDKVVPKISVPGITQEQFQDAFNVLDECLAIDVPYLGFEYPFLGIFPGENLCWWQLDTSASLGGAKWANQEFAENVIRGFMGLQAENADGRIDHSGHVPVRGGCYHLSSLPHYFEAAYDVARRCKDTELRRSIYDSMRKYLKWWLAPYVKRDPRTGLVTGWFEETVSYWQFGSMPPYTIAPVDTNIAIVVGADRIAKLARQLGDSNEAEKYNQICTQQKHAINQYLWDEEDGVYYPYNVKTQQREPQLFSSTFNAFRIGIARPEQVERLIPKLLDQGLFNWGKIPVNSAAQTHPHFTNSAVSCGTAHFGMVWPLSNMAIIEGLRDIDRYDLAGELAWQSIQVFNGQYDEFFSPLTGHPLGHQRYCWTAAAYIQAIIEYLFGIDYDTAEGKLCIMPHIPEELAHTTISIENLILPNAGQTRLSVIIQPHHKHDDRLITIKMKGDLVEHMIMEVAQPQSEGQTLPVIMNLPDSIPFEYIQKPNCSNVPGIDTIAGVRIPVQHTLIVRFSI